MTDLLCLYCAMFSFLPPGSCRVYRPSTYFTYSEPTAVHRWHNIFLENVPIFSPILVAGIFVSSTAVSFTQQEHVGSP